MATGSALTPTSPASPVEGDRLTFHWTTDAPDAKNWVGIYDGTRQPGNGGSLLWKYTPGAVGDVQLDTAALTGGPYTAYLLAKDGYAILAKTEPFTFRPKPAVVRPHSAVDALTTAPVAPGAAVSVRLGGLWSRPAGNPAGTAAFRRVSGAGWLSVAADGTVTGTAPAGPTRNPEVVVVGVRDSAGASDTVTVQIPVADPAGPLRLKTASWNLADAGAGFTDAPEKQLRVVLAQGLDVLALQETAGNAARALADALGWYAYQSQGSVGILSRYPLTAVTPVTADLPAAGATVQLPGGRSVRFWAAHLDEADYGPYAVQDGRGAAEVLAGENASVRLRQARALADAVRADAAGRRPVVVAGALSSPSHLDWTAATAATHGVAGPVAWPVTTMLQAAGLTDSFREENRDPAKAPGFTWSPTRRQRADGRAEPQDRIDYVLYAGPLKLAEAHTLVADWPATGTDPAALAANEWPSDTAAAVATFQL
ncbi:endonuclease/exonuclease/phosphatase family protein [Kitasatospora sp. RG8]|uniref:endonuclease/exonuclease/phosphatase family protein n=1 Tax=Kitasatospora sp. RG8 TaxID=2820815 RepID=UPI001ADF2005|nr:endonuclease/exonuclease/phosphatase family protein [Kitasatospora sp. RG8]MBP0449311.1 endonuclease/exonuclease/phosphatase family protein [Kitasatospora sp. RG8]